MTDPITDSLRQIEEFEAAEKALAALLDGLTSYERALALEDASKQGCEDRFALVAFVLQAHGKGR